MSKARDLLDLEFVVGQEYPTFQVENKTFKLLANCFSQVGAEKFRLPYTNLSH